MGRGEILDRVEAGTVNKIVIIGATFGVSLSALFSSSSSQLCRRLLALASSPIFELCPADPEVPRINRGRPRDGGQDLNHHLRRRRVWYVHATFSLLSGFYPRHDSVPLPWEFCDLRSRSDQIGQANLPSRCGWSVVNGFTSKPPPPGSTSRHTQLTLFPCRYDPTIGISPF